MSETQYNHHEKIKQKQFIITCPYCFKQFYHTDVNFRATKFYRNDRDIEKELGFNETFVYTDRENLPEVEKRKQYIAGMSSNLKAFWKSFGGVPTEPIPNNIGSSELRPWERPIVYKEMITSHLLNRMGMVEECVDSLGNRSDSRVCPHCHNPLPKQYGQFPIKKISIIGIRGAGKTVYISQLLKGFQNYATNVGLTAYPTSENEQRFIKDNAIEMGLPVPNSTLPNHFSQPMFYDVTRTDEYGNNITETVIFYDIAGENCESEAKLSASGFKDIILHSDGIILLIDPKQLLYIDSEMEEGRKYPPQLVVNTLHQLDLPKDQKGRCTIPVAACISKSDLIKNILPAEAFQLIQSTGKDKQGRCQREFNAKYYNVLEKKLIQLLGERESARTLITSFINGYLHFNWFAVCGIGCNVVRQVNKKGIEIATPSATPSPRRIEEPLYWLFKQFGFIGANDKIKLPAIITERVHTYRIEKRKFTTKTKRVEIVKDVNLVDEEALEAFIKHNEDYFAERIE